MLHIYEKQLGVTVFFHIAETKRANKYALTEHYRYKSDT